MRHKYASFIRFINFAYDIFVLNISLIIIFLKLEISTEILGFWYQKSLFFMWLNINSSWIAAALFGNVYTLRNLIYFKEGTKNSVKGFLLMILFLVTLDFFSNSKSIYTREIIFQFIALFSILFWGARFLFYLLKKVYNIEFYSGRKVLLVGSEEITELMKKTFNDKKEYGFLYGGYQNDMDFALGKEKFFHQLYSKIKNENIEEVFFAKTRIGNDDLYELIQELDKKTIRVRIIPDFFKFYTKPQNLTFIGDMPLLSLREEPLQSLLNRMIKRAFDVLFSLTVILLIFSWLFPILSVLIKLESRGPIFFKQLRSGRDNKQFWCYKFRSMRVNIDSDKIQATKNDTRITRIGSIIRKTSIDEFPQFFNVLLSNMSIVGPRPHMLKHTEQYSAIVDKYMIRHFVKPGITGWAQVNGFRGEISNVEDIEKRVEHDIWYIEHWSLLLDIQVVLLTIYNILKGEDKAA